LNDFLLDDGIVLVPLPGDNVVGTPGVTRVGSKIEARLGTRRDFLGGDAEVHGKQE
jgi:hypothetical protein